ncbi:MAG: helix-turn-helix transcriptional regulator [Bacilli bacterium]|nr:helix-turn-helix transcriptional regulator [Bacilli bacterium]
MGDILGVDRTTIGFYEDGKRMPSINYLYRFCKYFKISFY